MVSALWLKRCCQNKQREDEKAYSGLLSNALLTTLIVIPMDKKVKSTSTIAKARSEPTISKKDTTTTSTTKSVQSPKKTTAPSKRTSSSPPPPAVFTGLVFLLLIKGEKAVRDF